MGYQHIGTGLLSLLSLSCIQLDYINGIYSPLANLIKFVTTAVPNLPESKYIKSYICFIL